MSEFFDDNANVRAVGLLDNSFFVMQQQKGGHKAGLDAVLLAATVPEGFKGRVSDFGAGNGAAGMAVLQRCDDVLMDFIERDPDAVELVLAAANGTKNAHLSSRIEVFCTDLTDTKKLKEISGRIDGDYQLIIANPPYNDASHRESPDQKRADAHVMKPDDFLAWVKSANSMLSAKGYLTMIIRPANLNDLLKALDRRFGTIRIKPIHSKSDDTANRLLVCARKGGRAPLELLPPLIIHKSDGSFTDTADDIFRGKSGIDLLT